MKKICHIFLLLTIYLSPKIYAQVVISSDQTTTPTTDEQLAVQYYQSGEYDKALVYYKKLYQKDEKSYSPNVTYYNYYLNCLIFTKDYKGAEKLVKTQSKRFPGNLCWHVDMGRVYQAEGEEDKMKKEFDAGINAINGGTSSTAINDLANAFMGINETNYAIQTYKKGDKELKGIAAFNLELADVYAMQKDYLSMVNEYLDYVELYSANEQDVKNRLQAKMDEDADDKISPVLKTELIKRSQKNPDNTIWSDMLMWLYIQQKNFTGALIQAKSVDKRDHLDGKQVMELAKTAIDNDDFDAASDSYDYVISLGGAGSNFRAATIGKVNAKYLALTVGGSYTQEQLVALQKEMNATLDELGRDSRTIKLMSDLAHLEAFYLHDTKGAIAILESAIAITNISELDRANCKLELGDVLLLDGQVWEASLRYSQVEKLFKYDVIGQEAKFRNAKVAFYIGDFKWAQIQLNVLKGATSKLISNDAMDLSITITENFALDSNPIPLMRFAHADLMVFQNRFDSALVDLDSIDKYYPNHSLEDDVLMKRYQIAMKQQKWTEAAGYLQKIIDNYSTDLLGDDATFLLAELYDKKLNDKDKAMQIYQDVFVKFPSSTFATDARKRYRTLRGDKLDQ